MPTYEYRCEGCGSTVEVVQRFTDAPLTTCETCGGALRKVYAPVGIVFKGSGFYKTDSRPAPKSAPKASGDAKADAKTEGGGGATDASSPSGPAATDKASKDPAPAASSPKAASTAPASSSD